MKARELELLDRLVGNWDVEFKGKMADGTPVQGKGTANVAPLSVDRGFRSELRLDIPGMGEYHEDDLWGFDQWGGKLHFYSITSTGAVHDHSGRWRDDKTLEFHWEGLYEGRASKEDTTFSWISDKEIHCHEIDESEGQPDAVFDYILRRRQKP